MNLEHWIGLVGGLAAVALLLYAVWPRRDRTPFKPEVYGAPRYDPDRTVVLQRSMGGNHEATEPLNAWHTKGEIT